MDKKYWLSVIIPAYNCEKTIGRLIESILAQNMNDEIEVVIADDNSIDNFLNIARYYADDIHIIYGKTKPREIHCPGNTRLDGLSFATGEWVTFIDHDDVFESDKFRAIKEAIDENPASNLLFSNFREVSEDQTRVLTEYIYQITWLHGKFYRRQWLIDNNINFKENLRTHEDLYFNSQVFATIYRTDEPYLKMDDFTYRWIHIPSSTSRAKYTSNKEHLFLEENFEDYVAASYDSWMSIYKKDKEHDSDNVKQSYFNQFCSIILFYFFYYQGFIWWLGKDKVRPEILELIRTKLYDMIDTFETSKEEIINHLHDIPKYYVTSKLTAQVGVGKFVESKSFDDFIRNL